MNRKRYVNKFRKLIKLERKEEMKRHINEIKRLSPYQRQKKKRALLNLRAKKKGTGLGGRFIVQFLNNKKNVKLAETDIKVGDLVLISRKNPLKKGNPTGTVIETSNYSINVVFDNPLPTYMLQKKLRMDLYVNDITFQRMEDSLNTIENKNEFNKDLLDKVIGIKKPIKVSKKIYKKTHGDAADKALKCDDILLLHGPPGTGKTTTLVKIISQSLKEGDKILATADSNTAVDNMVFKLVRNSANVIRIGHPFKVDKLLREHTLDYILEDHPNYKKIAKMRDEAYEIISKMKKYTYPTQRYRRGMSNEKIIKLAEEKKGSRGIHYKKIKSMAKYLEGKKKADSLFEKATKLENNLVEKILKNADVVCSTNTGAGSEILKKYNFDLLIMDESTQAMETSALIPLIKVNKVIFAGDHKQLPPTILSQKALKKGFDVSIFERLMNEIGETNSYMLDLQFRMNKKIADFSSKTFYDGKLKTEERIRNRQLRIRKHISKRNYYALNPRKPIVFVDTYSKGESENRKNNRGSYLNIEETKYIFGFISELLKLGIKEKQIAIISPYKAQVNYIKDNIHYENIEIDTIDGFQGRGKDIIIVSFVRSNKNKDIGFLKDYRRLNVALTRARKKLILIGDKYTLEEDPIYNKLINYCENIY